MKKIHAALKSAALIFCILVQTSCSSPKVHLYAKYLSKDKVEHITSILEDSDYTVLTNTLNFPSTVTSNSIIYSALLQDPYSLDNLITILNSNDIEISQNIPMSSGNHKYTKDSMALFILPKDHSILSVQDIAQKYRADKCDNSFNLILREDGSYSFFGQEIDRKNSKYQNGFWKYRGFPYIEMQSSHEEQTWSWYLIASQSVITDKIGQVNILELRASSVHSIIGDCVLTYGIRR